MEENYCLFYKNDQIQFGLILGLQKNKLILQPLKGQRFFSSLRQTLYQWKGQTFNDAEEGVALLTQKSTTTLAAAEAIDLEIIHELLEPGEAFSLAELVADFTDDPTDPWASVALFLALKAETTLFQNKNLSFTARSREEIEKIKATAQKKELEEQKKDRETAWCSELHQGLRPDTPPETQVEWEAFKKRLLHFLIHWSDSQEKELFTELLHIKDFNSLEVENQVRKLLELAGTKVSWGRLQVLRLAVSKDFTQVELELSQEIATGSSTPSCFDQERRDLRNQASYTIDSTTTKDFDDGLSFEILKDNGIRLQIHIADVASYLPPENALFTMASHRVSSLYTLKGKFSMLPTTLSEDFLSLKEQLPKACQTYDFTFDSDFTLIKSEIYPSLIKVTKNLSYDEADERIKSDEAWSKLNQLSEALTEARVAKGALNFERKEYNLDISDPENIQIKLLERQTPANTLIQECAILANGAAAKLAQEGLRNFYFRNQPPYGVSPDLPEGETPQLRDLKIQPARLGLRAEGHSALGLEAYGQVTSPIRRFVDLVGQWLIYAILADRPSPFSEEVLLGWLPILEDTAKSYARTERALVDHWKILYLSQNAEKTYQVRWERTLRGELQLVRLVDLDFAVEIYLEEIEQEFDVQIESINPALNQVRIVKVAGES